MYLILKGILLKAVVLIYISCLYHMYILFSFACVLVLQSNTVVASIGDRYSSPSLGQSGDVVLFNVCAIH